MGTNYYARYNICEFCGRYDELHIGKSSAGWTFIFQAQEDEITIKSYKEWIEFLLGEEIKIFDEYGDELTIVDFKDIIENKKKEKHNHTKEYPEGHFLDEEGNSFSEGEFS